MLHSAISHSSRIQKKFTQNVFSQITMAKEQIKLPKKSDEESELAEEGVADIRGDVLESILCHVPLIHLLSASHVSKSWNDAVFSSLRHFNKPKPWLIVHSQSSSPPYATVAVAYDPRSNLWLRLTQTPPVEYVAALRSSNSTLLYMLSVSRFSFSFDPFHLHWHHVDPPLVWRIDPIVAAFGRHVVIAGGACDFEDDPLSVEIYNLDTRRWSTCESMPTILKDSAASTWLSVAANTQKLFAMEQVSGITYSFDPNSRIWSGPFDLRRDQNIYFSVIGIFGDRMIMVGLVGNCENVKDIKVWEVNGEALEFPEEIGLMPKELVEKLKGGQKLSSIRISLMCEFLYIYNPGEPEELAVCEIDGDGVCRWRSLKNVAASDRSKVAERRVLTCANVGLGDLGKAVGSKRGSFGVVHSGILHQF